jgi:hypothetical protein
MCLAWSQPRTTSVAKTWTKSRAAALIALIGGLDGQRRDVIQLALGEC